ncbi:hypothetical protein C8Q76DRAFT_827041 [Earliella scabrosa]|nr:hypothetical protein C8Q76DRAFT_827041 [Earliella scabrosa]
MRDCRQALLPRQPSPQPLHDLVHPPPTPTSSSPTARSDGAILSDHNPIRVALAWARSGRPTSARDALPVVPSPFGTTFTLRGGARADGLAREHLSCRSMVVRAARARGGRGCRHREAVPGQAQR